MSPHQKKYRDQRDLGHRPSEGFDFGKHVELALVSQSIQVTIFDFDVSWDKLILYVYKLYKYYYYIIIITIIIIIYSVFPIFSFSISLGYEKRT